MNITRRPNSALTWLTPSRAELHLKCPCGGQVYLDDISYGQFRYEAFCDSCKSCDPNGYPSLATAIAGATRYFGRNNGAEMTGDEHGTNSRHEPD